MYNVADYTFAPHKLVWREQASDFTVAVVGSKDGKPIIPDHKLMLVPFDDENEAHFVCVLLSSVIARLVVKSYVIETSTSTHVLENIAIPKYDSSNALHLRLASLSQQAHALTAEGKDVSAIEADIDLSAAELWGISTKELEEIRKSLGELKQ
ncbi:hypothetical protein D4S03_08620 [bacterium]|nr:MAG: hypothetical protein D4S03_08620 [bacterium]